ncbi:GNAT family N-acetyltransferase [Massilia sp. DD77]|uniref:GNAT family N-acetyltransferase n=1 Tax=Massilia sp. DD77 TaxID=3109349 RepID=UPI00300072B8
MIDLHIRPEQPADAGAIAALLHAAFAGNPHSNHTEHLIVERLRASGRLSVALAALLPDGRLAGHVAFSKVSIDGRDEGWYGLGPLAVLPQLQGQGVGTALVEAGLSVLRRKGARGCVVLGEPAYYGRFGFAQDAGLRYPGPPPEYFMALAFDSPAPQGVVAYDSAFA